MARWCAVPEKWCATDGRTNGLPDGRKKWHVEVGALPKSSHSYFRTCEDLTPDCCKLWQYPRIKKFPSKINFCQLHENKFTRKTKNFVERLDPREILPLRISSIKVFLLIFFELFLIHYTYKMSCEENVAQVAQIYTWLLWEKVPGIKCRARFYK